MKATIKSLKKALKACAEAHNVEYKWWRDAGQVSLKSESVPVYADVKAICEAFYGRTDMLSVGWGFTTVYLEPMEKRDVDEILLSMALPSQLNLVQLL